MRGRPILPKQPAKPGRSYCVSKKCNQTGPSRNEFSNKRLFEIDLDIESATHLVVSTRMQPFQAGVP
jgi:hypothetical protein